MVFSCSNDDQVSIDNTSECHSFVLDGSEKTYKTLLPFAYYEYYQDSSFVIKELVMWSTPTGDSSDQTLYLHVVSYDEDENLLTVGPHEIQVSWGANSNLIGSRFDNYKAECLITKITHETVSLTFSTYLTHIENGVRDTIYLSNCEINDFKYIKNEPIYFNSGPID